MAELLLELLSEEIPARMQNRAREDLATLVRGVLNDAGLGYDDGVQTFATPRRLVLVLTGLPLRQHDRTVERKGPRADAPEQAKQGFLKGLAGLDYTLETRDEKKGKVIFALVRETGRATRDILAEQLPVALARFPWPKSMRWGSGDVRWVRPLQSILCLLDGEVVPFRFGHVESGNVTAGHRFMAPKPSVVKGFRDYAEKLREAKVILDGAERRRLIAEGAARLAATEGLVVEDDPALLDEIAGLVEWPVPLRGRIDPAFMDIPPEVLVLTMRQNQKYLALRTPDGKLAPRFVVVANTEAEDGGAAIVAGNERVLRARLWDARFFWEQDRRQSLESRLPKLDSMVFHAELGTQGQRVERLVALAGALVPHVPGADRMLAERAALLAKADLVTGMVGEFPELQGIMGGHYARLQGEPEAVADAIRDHYAPKRPDDRCPTAPNSIVVALADKLDTLVGFFGVGIKPTGSKDPFSLRRAALGIIRLILENNISGLPLRLAIYFAFNSYQHRFVREYNAVMLEILDFFAERMKVHLRAEGIRPDIISATYRLNGEPGISGPEDDLRRLVKRANALQEFLSSDDGANLLAGYRRASNIVEIEEKKDGRRYEGFADHGKFVDTAELKLSFALDGAKERIEVAIGIGNYRAAMSELAKLREPIDAFFERVMVNAPEPELRENRLRLLGWIRSALGGVADFSVIEDTGRPVG